MGGFLYYGIGVLIIALSILSVINTMRDVYTIDESSYKWDEEKQMLSVTLRNKNGNTKKQYYAYIGKQTGYNVWVDVNEDYVCGAKESEQLYKIKSKLESK